MAKSSAPPYAKLGVLIQEARDVRGWGQKELATRIGYAASGYVTISRVEKGHLLLPAEKMSALIRVLDLNPIDVERLSGPQKSNPVATAKLHRENQRRIADLNESTLPLNAAVERWFDPLQRAREHIDDDFLAPLLKAISGVSGVEDALGPSIEALAEPHRAIKNVKLNRELVVYRSGVARSLFQALGRSTAGAAGGGAVGGAAAFATYSAVGAWATASTGAAIGGLSGVAAANATLAAIGGGSLATGGLGIAGGTLILGSIVAAPAAIATGTALVLASKKIARREQSEALRIAKAEAEFKLVKARMQEAATCADHAQSFLGGARLRAKQQISTLKLPPARDDRTIPWTKLPRAEQDKLRKLLELAAVTLTVLPLPAIATPDPDASGADVQKLEAATREWNDAVLQEAIAWFALN
ncbi:MAG TPA: helix-turn-helix transcriptional regulator [Dehalococcoidia bacterium]|jgi:transcriptional regulator with XRE-family HTH domain